MEKCSPQVCTGPGVLRKYIHLFPHSGFPSKSFCLEDAGENEISFYEFTNMLSAVFVNLMGKVPAYFLAHVFSIIILSLLPAFIERYWMRPCTLVRDKTMNAPNSLPWVRRRGLQLSREVERDNNWLLGRNAVDFKRLSSDLSQNKKLHRINESGSSLRLSNNWLKVTYFKNNSQPRHLLSQCYSNGSPGTGSCFILQIVCDQVCNEIGTETE